MSDVGILSYEYQQARQLTQRIGNVLAAAHDQRVDRQEQMELARLLRGLVDLVDPLNARPEDAAAALTVPVGLARRLRDQRSGLGAALPTLAQRLRRGEPLEQDDLELLETINGLTEREASIVFRRMVRR
jgi:ABC-type transporter Mla subunit MlaD